MFFICPSWLSFILYNPLRKFLTNRKEILDECNVKADSVVLEIGAGNGFLTEMLATRARRVIAVELQAGMIRKLKKRVPPDSGKIDIIEGNISSIPSDENIADICLLYYSFHEVADKPGAVINICTMLKQGGILAIYEPSLEVGKKDMETTVSMFKKNGFSLRSSRRGLFTRFAMLTRVA